MNPSRRAMGALAERHGAPDSFGTTFVSVAGELPNDDWSPDT